MPRKPGRPPVSTEARTRQHQLRLTDATWAALLAVAARERLLYGGVPSRAEAVRWLVERDRQPTE